MHCIYKAGVNLMDLHPRMVQAIPSITMLWLTCGETLVITAGRDGEHMEGSKHYEGKAVDCRTRYFNKALASLLARVLEHLLGPDFDIVLHDTHIHVEYDPKVDTVGA